MTTTLRAQTPTDLLSLIPHLVRFHVEDGIVLLVLSGKTIEMSARFDHDLVEDRAQLARTLDRVLAQFPAARVFVASYGERLRAESSLAVLESMLLDSEVVDAVYCDGRRWWSWYCLDACCQGIPCEPEGPLAVQAAVETGSRPLASRSELEAMVEGPTLIAQAQHLGLLTEVWERVQEMSMPARRQRMLEQVRAFVGEESRELEVEEALELALLAGHVPARDEAWLEMSVEQAARHVQLWARVVQLAPDRHAVAPLCLLGCAGWLQGNGALLGVAIDRAMGLDPDYSMLSILVQVHAGMVNPSMWERVRAGVG